MKQQRTNDLFVNVNVNVDENSSDGINSKFLSKHVSKSNDKCMSQTSLYPKELKSLNSAKEATIATVDSNIEEQHVDIILEKLNQLKLSNSVNLTKEKAKFGIHGKNRPGAPLQEEDDRFILLEPKSSVPISPVGNMRGSSVSKLENRPMKSSERGDGSSFEDIKSEEDWQIRNSNVMDYEASPTEDLTDSNPSFEGQGIQARRSEFAEGAVNGISSDYKFSSFWSNFKESAEDIANNARGSYFNEDRYRSFSAPPVDNVFVEDDVELEEIQQKLNYSDFYRRNCKNEPRLQPPNSFITNQWSNWACQHSDLIARAFSSNEFMGLNSTQTHRPNKSITPMSLTDRIDEDYPESEKSTEYRGTSRTTTPVGDVSFLDNDIFNSRVSRASHGILSADPIMKTEIEHLATPIPLSPIERTYTIDDMVKEIIENGFLREMLAIYIEQNRKDIPELSMYIKAYDRLDASEAFTPKGGRDVTQDARKGDNVRNQSKIKPDLTVPSEFSLKNNFPAFNNSQTFEGALLNQDKNQTDSIPAGILYAQESVASSLSRLPGAGSLGIYDPSFLGSSESAKFVQDLCVLISKDQEGSRRIQKRLECCAKRELSWFFRNILWAASELSTNLFGNYVIQKIIPFLSDLERTELVERLVGQVYSLSTHPYGCRVIQKLVDCSADINFILEEIQDDLLRLIEDQNGNHVIQKCIEKSQDRTLILAQFKEKSLFLSTHRYGCRVIQRLLEFCDKSEVKGVLALLINDLEYLVNDQYGNYVIQHVLSVGGQEEKDAVIEKIIEKSYELSKYKFSSNVIEQCVKISTNEQKKRFLNKFLEVENNRLHIYNMCCDMYGNYVVQRFYDYCSLELQNEIKKALKPYLKELRKIPFARHILFKIGSSTPSPL